MLEIGRLEGVELEVGPESVEAAIESAISATAEDFVRGVRPRSRDHSDLPPAVADPCKGLRTVLTHLLQNAAMFSPDDGEVRLRTEVSGTHLDIFIEDDGEGVDPADLPRLMLPFEQGQNALVRRVEGAGLGLAICRTHLPGHGRAAGAHLPAGPGPDRTRPPCRMRLTAELRKARLTQPRVAASGRHSRRTRRALR